MTWNRSPEILPLHDQRNNQFLIYSHCFGYDLAQASFDNSGAFNSFICTSAGELVSVLPEDIDGWIRLENRPFQAELK